MTITNLLLEQTKSNAGAFIDGAKLQIDGGFRTLTNNIAFELFGNGTGARAQIASGSNTSGSNYTVTISNAQQIVNFEVGMVLVNFTISAGSISSVSSTQLTISSVNRATGVITGVLNSGTDSSWTTANKYLGVYGDIVSGTISTGTSLCLSGLGAWLPTTAPSSGDNFWGVDRSVDPTRLGGLRYDASAYTIEEGMTKYWSAA